MASFYFEVTYTDGRKEVVRVGAKTQVLYEREFGKSFWTYTEERRVEHLHWITWRALQDAGQKVAEFDSWMDLVEDLATKVDTPEDPVDDRAVNPEVDPTKKAQQPDT